MDKYQDIPLKFNNEVVEICKLRKSKTPLISKVSLDEFTNEANKNFDYDFDGTNLFYPFESNDVIKNLDFNILCIVGASGSGKSTFSKYFGDDIDIAWDNTKSIMSNFSNPQEAIDKLCSVGLNSIPTWCKPRNVLSVGEGFRADLARKINKNGFLIDEFTSTVDRNVALSCSKSISKYIRKNNIKNCVFVSCHKDFIDVLCPDYVIDLDDECVYDTRRLSRHEFDIQIYETKEKEYVWKIFRQHHYLSGDISKSSTIYVAYLNNELVGMVAILPLPNGMIKGKAYRVHRLVILLDYQGLGIGTKLLDWVANKYSEEGCLFYIRTSHNKLHNYLMKSGKWEETMRSGQISPHQTGNLSSWKTTNRTPFSYKYLCNRDKYVEIFKKDYLQESLF